jgi:hypothetical protein
MADLDKLANDIRALCNGHPHAKIAWPHRELHALADRAQALARRDGGEEPVAKDAVDRVMAVLNYWFNGSRRIDRNSDMVKQLAALVDHPAPSTAEDACMAGGAECSGCDTSGRCTFVCELTPADPRPDPAFLGHLIVPNSGVGAVFIDKGQPIPLMGNKGHVIPVYDGPQNVTADPLEALREAREALVYYSKAEAYGRRIILNVEVMYDRGKKARQALANIKALMGEAG